MDPHQLDCVHKHATGKLNHLVHSANDTTICLSTSNYPIHHFRSADWTEDWTSALKLQETNTFRQLQSNLQSQFTPSNGFASSGRMTRCYQILNSGSSSHLDIFHQTAEVKALGGWIIVTERVLRNLGILPDVVMTAVTHREQFRSPEKQGGLYTLQNFWMRLCTKAQVW